MSVLASDLISELDVNVNFEALTDLQKIAIINSALQQNADLFNEAGKDRYIQNTLSTGAELVNWLNYLGVTKEYVFGNQDSLRNWILGMGQLKSGQKGTLEIVSMGDSLSRYMSNFDNIAQEVLGDGGLGFISNEANADDVNNFNFAWSGTWTHTDQGTTQEDWGINGWIDKTSSGAASVTIKTYKKSTSIRVWWAKNTTKGTFDVTIDGGAPQTINCAGAAGLGSTLISGLTDIPHTIVINNVVGTIGFYGLELRRSEGGLIVHKLSNGGSTSVSWSTYTAYLKTFLSTVAPDLVGIYLGANDAENIPPSSFQTYMTSLIADIRTVSEPSVVASISNKRGLLTADDTVYNLLIENYRNVLFRMIENYDITVFDIFDFMPLWTEANAAGLMTDTIHPNEFGKEIIARELFESVVLKHYDGLPTQESNEGAAVVDGMLRGRELVGNGSMENGTITSWNDQGNHSYTKITNDAYRGSACMEIDASGAGDSGNCVFNQINVTQYADYELELALKAISGANTISILIGGINHVFTVTEEWRLYKLRLTNRSTTGSIYVTFALSGVGVMRMDAVSVRQIYKYMDDAMGGLPEYADRAAALAGGLTTGMLYKTSTGVLMVS
jgi:lysophospholipase L1-like esterase